MFVQMKSSSNRKVHTDSAVHLRRAGMRQFILPGNEAQKGPPETEIRSWPWVHLPSIEGPGRLCGRPGHPYCWEHQYELETMEPSWLG
jgi:hypothetical protein